jgi:hypothetical protein
MEEKNRRTHLRLPKEARVTCQEVTYPLGQAPERSVRMLDLSEGGVRLESDLAYEDGTLLQVALSLEGWQRHTSSFLKHDEEMLDRPLTALGRTVRCEALGNDRYEIGMQFLDIWDDHWRAMRVFLNREFRTEQGAGA